VSAIAAVRRSKEKIVTNKNCGWRRDGEGKAHLLIKQGCVIKPRCKFLSEVKGAKVPAPITGHEDGYCYNCHYFAIFDTLPKAASQILTHLLNREVDEKVRKERDLWIKNMEAREKEVEARHEAVSKMYEEARKKDGELANLRDAERENKEFIEIGKAILKIPKILGRETARGFLDEMQKYGPRGFGGW
jgi:hypothetical protein